MYRSQDSETLDELRAENAELKKKLSNLKWLRLGAKYWCSAALTLTVIFSAVSLVDYYIYLRKSETHDKAERWRDAREPPGFLNCILGKGCRVHFEDKPPVYLNCSFDEGCMVSRDEN